MSRDENIAHDPAFWITLAGALPFVVGLMVLAALRVPLVKGKRCWR